MPFNSEISVKRKHGILIIVMHCNVHETCVGTPLYPNHLFTRGRVS